MLAIRYHRQLARSIYIWGVFTPNDFGALIGALALNMVILDSNWGIGDPGGLSRVPSPPSARPAGGP